MTDFTRGYTLRAIVLVATLSTVACVRLATGPRPAAVAGVWIDSTRSVPGDTLLWALSPEGSALLDLTARTDHPSEAPLRSDPYAGPARRARTYHGTWYTRPSASGGGAPELCFMRPGREAETCSPFSVDTTTVAGVRTVRLRLEARPEGRARAGRTLLRHIP